MVVGMKLADLIFENVTERPRQMLATGNFLLKLTQFLGSRLFEKGHINEIIRQI